MNRTSVSEILEACEKLYTAQAWSEKRQGWWSITNAEGEAARCQSRGTASIVAIQYHKATKTPVRVIDWRDEVVWTDDHEVDFNNTVLGRFLKGKKP